MTSGWHRHTLDPVHTVYPSATPYDTPERTALVQTVRAFAMDEVLPVANEPDPRHEDIPDHLLERMGELGLFGVLIGEEEGGLGLGVLDYCLVSEELARAWLSVGSIIARGNGTGCAQCAAVRDGDEWVVTGTKRWVGHALSADFIHLLASTRAPGEGRGPSDGLELFLVEKERGAFPDGVTGTPIDKIGYFGLTTWQLELDRLRLPADALQDTGEKEGQGFKHSLGWLHVARDQTAARGGPGPRRPRGRDHLLPAARAVRRADRQPAGDPARRPRRPSCSPPRWLSG